MISKILYTLVITLLFVASVINAEPLRGVRIEGNQRIDTTTIRSYVLIKEGEEITQAALDRSLKNLYGTGLFSDVKLRQENGVVAVYISENPVINRVAFEGNAKLKEDTLRSEVQLRPRTVYSRAKVSADVERLQTLYRRTGRYAAVVDPKLIELPQNRVDLVFEISEGERTDIRRVSFVNNKYSADNTLRSVISTKESAWYRLLTADDTYDAERIEYDKELLRRHYLENGFADFEVTNTIVELAPDKSSFDIRFVLNEGKRYKVENVDTKIALRNVSKENVEPLIEVEKGKYYDFTQVESTIEEMTRYLGNLGYPFVKIKPAFNKNTNNQTIDITFNIGEGPKIFIERIDISGNTRTLDEVIRREFQLAEGDAFNADKLRDAERRIRNLGFFEDVKVDVDPGTSPDQATILVEVKEQSTGELSFGAGFSTNESLLGDVRLRESNFLGKGQQVELATVLSSRRTDIDFSFTEPYFLGRNLSAGVDLFRTKLDLQRESSFDEERLGGGLRMGYRINNNLRQSWNYTLRDVEITDVDQNASRFIKDQEGRAITSSVGHELLFDYRDNRFEPTNGYYVRINNDVAGLGGDVKFLRNRIGTGVFYPLYKEEWVIGLESDVGHIFSLNDDEVRINDRFFVGGNSLRGFEIGGIGPRDITTTDSLGGNLFFTTKGELRFPLGLPESLGLTGRAFVDAGTLTDSEDSGSEVRDSGSIRVSAGAGLAWRSPFGPVRIDFAQAVVDEEYDVREFFRFSFGTRF